MRRHFIFVVLLGAGTTACNSGNDTTKAATEQAAPGSSEANTAAFPDPAAYQIRKGEAGLVKKGMPVAALHTIAAKQQLRLQDTTLQQEGQSYPAFVLHSYSSTEELLVEQQCTDTICSVWRISVLSDAYKTPEGLGVGSKYGEVQQVYPIKNVTLSDAGFVAVAEQAGLSFVLDAAALPAEHLARFTPADVPANLVVKRVIVY